jgi:Xaa-Pro aminopeptidase
VDVAAIQAALAEQGLDAWVMYDFRGSNAIARRMVGMPEDRVTTRRWFYVVPRSGVPLAVVSAVEPGVLEGLPGRAEAYRSWRELEERLRAQLAGLGRVAMEYSPRGAVPYVSRVDAGTVELVRSLGPEVVSSGDLVQWFTARWTPDQRALHETASRACMAAKDDAFALVRARLGGGEPVTESGLQDFVMGRIGEAGLMADDPCIVAVNDHAANPHFETAPGADDRVIAPGDVLLLDFWGKVADRPEAVYCDYTWMAFCGQDVPPRLRRAWEAVREARDAAVDFADRAMAEGRPVRGAEVDAAARRRLDAHGFGPHVLHRTGHSIGVDLHGDGVNIDDLETRDERTIVPGVCFSVEPGVYLHGEFGVRSEVDVIAGESGVDVTGEVQRDLVLLA